MSYIPRLKKKYKEEIVPALMEQFQYSTVMEVPRLTKICVNQGIGAATQDKKLVDNALAGNQYTIAGQLAVPTRAKKSVSNFKLERRYDDWRTCNTHETFSMYEFLDRLISVASASCS
jgi:large subunit ribosomal protein L5